MTIPTRIGVSAALFAGGVAAGHWLTPARIVTVDRAVTSDQEIRAATTAVAEATRAQTQLEADLTKVRIVRIVQRPDGGTETTTEERQEQHARHAEATEQAQQVAEAKIEYRDRIEYRERERIVERQKQSDWSAAALVGLRLPGRESTVFGGVLTRRIVGPVEAGVWGMREGTAWAGGLAVGVRW